MEETIKSPGKSFEFIQFSLRSGKDIFKEGGHVTPVYKDQVFRMHYDNRRRIIDEGNLLTVDSDVLLDSVPFESVKEVLAVRRINRYHKQTYFCKHVAPGVKNRYKDYTDLAVRNFVKGLLSSPPKYNLKREGELCTYNGIVEYLKVYEKKNEGVKLRLSKQSMSNLVNRNMVDKSVPRTKECINFVNYIKKRFPDFDESSFFKV